jgi:cell division protease FtsH
MSPYALPASPLEPPPPLHHRRSPDFERLLEIERGDSLTDRLTSHFLVAPHPARHTTLLGPLRCALAWEALPRFLDLEGWSVAGSFGERPRMDETARVAFGAVELGEHERLEFPTNLTLFLAGPSERCVLRFDRDESGRSPTVSLGLTSSSEDGGFLDRWFALARQDNVLRGKSLRIDGRLVTERGLATGECLVISADARQRIDLAVRRFAASGERRLSQLGLRRRAGLILAGPPGTGKTSVCRELSGRIDCTFLWVTPGDLASSRAIAEVYELARWIAPTVVVLEDLDLIAEARDRGNRSAALGELMNELDGIGGDQSILTVATTNRLEVVEEAVRNRPGRFDRIIRIDPPDVAGRGEMLRARFAGCRVETEDLEWFAGLLDGATGAEIEEAVNGAIAMAALGEPDSQERPRIGRAHLERSLEWLDRLPSKRDVGFGS